jgi:hypothetical protein
MKSHYIECTDCWESRFSSVETNVCPICVGPADSTTTITYDETSVTTTMSLPDLCLASNRTPNCPADLKATLGRLAIDMSYAQRYTDTAIRNVAVEDISFEHDGRSERLIFIPQGKVCDHSVVRGALSKTGLLCDYCDVGQRGRIDINKQFALEDGRTLGSLQLDREDSPSALIFVRVPWQLLTYKKCHPAERKTIWCILMCVHRLTVHLPREIWWDILARLKLGPRRYLWQWVPYDKYRDHSAALWLTVPPWG